MVVTNDENVVLDNLFMLDLVGGALAVAEPTDKVGVAILEEEHLALASLYEGLDVDLRKRSTCLGGEHSQLSQGILQVDFHLVGEVSGTGHLVGCPDYELEIVTPELFRDLHPNEAFLADLERKLVVGE